MKQKREFRRTAAAQLRAKKGAKTPAIEGYGAVFNELSEDLGWFREMIMPGAFKDCLAADDPPPDVRCLFNHDASAILGRTVAKTLALAEDSTGLHFACDLPDTQTARDVLTSIDRGDISQCSFGFFVRKQKWTEEIDEDGTEHLIRELHAVDVFDVSPVTFPAYTGTTVDVRALWPDGQPAALRLFAKTLRTRPDDDENANGCECECSACQDDNCAQCSNASCDDDDCKNCPNQRSRAETPALQPADAELRRWMAARLRLAGAA